MRVTSYRMPRSKQNKNKYGNRKIVIDGISFDSVKEGNHYIELKYRMAAGEIDNLEVHKPFELQPSFRDRDGKWVRPITYQADFVYTDLKTGKQIIEDVKSAATAKDQVYRLKKKMMMYNGLYIDEV